MKPKKTSKEEAFKELYNQLMPRLLAFAYKWNGDHLLAEDVVQEAFMKVWNKWEQLDKQQQLDQLLFTIVRNDLINQYQRKLKERNILSFFQQAEAPANERLLTEQVKKIHQLIEELPPRSKEVFLMSKRDGLTYSEIASELSVSVKSVEKHISKALKRLRERLKQAYLFFF